MTFERTFAEDPQELEEKIAGMTIDRVDTLDDGTTLEFWLHDKRGRIRNVVIDTYSDCPSNAVWVSPLYERLDDDTYRYVSRDRRRDYRSRRALIVDD